MDLSNKSKYTARKKPMHVKLTGEVNRQPEVWQVWFEQVLARLAESDVSDFCYCLSPSTIATNEGHEAPCVFSDGERKTYRDRSARRAALSLLRRGRCIPAMSRRCRH